MHSTPNNWAGGTFRADFSSKLQSIMDLLSAHAGYSDEYWVAYGLVSVVFEAHVKYPDLVAFELERTRDVQKGERDLWVWCSIFAWKNEKNVFLGYAGM
jgi:hypothetical protein